MGQRLPKAPSTDKVKEGVARLINPFAGGRPSPSTPPATPTAPSGPVMTHRADSQDIHLPSSGRRRGNKRVSMASPANRRMRRP